MSNDGFYFNSKQWLGDDAILLMDWDVRAMHLHLMCIAWQKTPPGILPDDDLTLRKWLSNPDLASWTDRIKPQLAQAWRIADSKWHQDGLIREWERQSSNSQKRRAAANARWKRDPSDEPNSKLDSSNTHSQSIAPPNATLQLLTIDGDTPTIPTQGFALSTILRDLSIFREDASQEEKLSIWTMGVKLLKHEGFPEDKVRTYLGKLIHEHGEKIVAEAVASMSLKHISPADAKSYLIGILRSESSKRKGRGRVAL